MSSTSRESTRERLHFTALADEILDIILIQISNLLASLQSIDGSDMGTFSGGSPSLVQTFIESIDGLHELFIINYYTEPDFLFSAILKHHESLETLSFNTPPDRHYRCKLPPVWAVEQLLRLRDQFRNLSVLDLDVALEEGQWVSTSHEDMDIR